MMDLDFHTRASWGYSISKVEQGYKSWENLACDLQPLCSSDFSSINRADGDDVIRPKAATLTSLSDRQLLHKLLQTSPLQPPFWPRVPLKVKRLGSTHVGMAVALFLANKNSFQHCEDPTHVD